ncbi:anti-sigma factor domain-containing protein [Gottfriedia acidiceleris]|uniref:anti-sigma factor domain-containing protein n=1 Tax=Gottfriedia acidiceleris TaxID=371036 RepID=UPI000B446FDA|nr:anti-sigma factor domain-containing protein [Gottfriedia acidiceleris]
MNNGIVLKVNHSSVVVLTANGEYLKCKKLLSSYSIGEEIQFPNNAIILNNKLKISIPKLIPVVIASSLILFSFLFLNLDNKEALAAGKVTINSEAKVSLILDKHLRVIALKGHNEQGKKVIDKLDNWKQVPLRTVMDDLVGEMEKSKVIQPDEKIKLTGEMRKEFKNKQNELNNELKDIQEITNYINIPNSKDIDQPKVKTQNHGQSQNKQENSFDSHSTNVTRDENNSKEKSSLKSSTVENNKVKENTHSKEVKNNIHQEEHLENKQSQWNHRNRNEHQESSKQNQKKQYNNHNKHQDKKKTEYNYDRDIRRNNNDQRKNKNNEGCHGCNNRYKNSGNENKHNNGWQNGSGKRSD